MVATVQHISINSTNIHMDVNSLGGSTERFIVVDFSNTNSFFHSSANYIHLENMDLQIDAANSAVYEIRLGFLENVDESHGDFYCIWNVAGTKDTGVSKEIYQNWSPNGVKCRSQSFVTNNFTRNSSAYRTNLNLASVLDPTTADTTPGNGDLILETEVTDQYLGLSLDIAYHTH
jgi:hypothetical protein